MNTATMARPEKGRDQLRARFSPEGGPDGADLDDRTGRKRPPAASTSSRGASSALKGRLMLAAPPRAAAEIHGRTLPR